MFDTMTTTKAVGAVCGSLLVFLLVGWAGSSLYHVGAGEGGKAEGEAPAQAYTIDTGETAAPVEGEAAKVDVAALLAAADAGAGEDVFKKKCSACHKVDGKNAVGPRLNGVVGRNHASVADFAGYSDANKAMSAEIWTAEAIFAFIESPKTYMPGTKMSFNGLPKPEDRANLVAYLATTK